MLMCQIYSRELMRTFFRLGSNTGATPKMSLSSGKGYLCYCAYLFCSYEALD